MAVVNLLNQAWYTWQSGPLTSLGSSPRYIEFILEPYTTTQYVYYKACIYIDPSKYKTITFTYSSKIGYGNSVLEFCIFDNMEDLTGQTIIDPSNWNESGGSVTVDVSTLSGAKYIGYQFCGNAYVTGSTAYQKVYITSFTAVERSYTLTYNANGGSGIPSSVSNIASTIISSMVPTRSGYDFLGWSTSPSATSASYLPGASITLSANTTLYAVWSKKVYRVHYKYEDGLGVQGKTHDVALTIGPCTLTKSSTPAGSYTVTLDSNGGVCSTESLTASRTTEYTFSKWNTNPSGTGTSYSPGDTYDINADLTLYPIYNSSTNTESVTLPTPVRYGFEFMGWATSMKATSGITGAYTPTGNVTLYAIWKSMGFVYIYDHTKQYCPYQVFIYDGSDWNQYIPYIYTESGWEVYSG